MTDTTERERSLRQLTRDYHDGRLTYERYAEERRRLLDAAVGWEGTSDPPVTDYELEGGVPAADQTTEPAATGAPRGSSTTMVSPGRTCSPP